MTLGPPLWATGSWAVDAWADGTWATTVNTGYGVDDLTTMWTFYERDTILPLPGFVNEDWRAYLNAVRGTTGNRDLNSAIYDDLK